MKTNPGIAAVQTLASLGYKFTLTGATIKAKYEGEGKLDPALVRPLLAQVKANKPEVVDFLCCYCPKCGGCCFAPDHEQRPRCLACDWNLLAAASERDNRGKMGEASKAPPRQKIRRDGIRQLSLIEAEGLICQEDLEADDPPF